MFSFFYSFFLEKKVSFRRNYFIFYLNKMNIAVNCFDRDFCVVPVQCSKDTTCFQVVNKFRSGDYNTLVSTCVGEEGLDIGDVDLIICYDSHKSPIRLVQRMGRTGRKRKGRIVMLITEGKEERVSAGFSENKIFCDNFFFI